MYNNSKNKVLLVVFILVILLIISILMIAVYNTKKISLEEYKISPNTITYDVDYNYISINNNSILKKEWDENYYLMLEKNNKYSLGTEPVIYDKSRNQLLVYGTIYQVYSNGDIIKKVEKTNINNVSESQFFKLNDRKYLLIGDTIGNENFSTKNYLIVTIDKAGNALLINNEINIKTINPLIINIGNSKFDVANEKLLVSDEVIDLKKINGSTNEYVEKVEEENNNNAGDLSSDSSNEGNIENNNQDNNTHIYNDIVNQIINISGLLSSQNKTNLYKNISLRNVSTGSNHIVVNYSIIDPENKYLNTYILLNEGYSTDSNNEQSKKYYIDKNSSSYKIQGLNSNGLYEVKLIYIDKQTKKEVIADSVMVLTNSDPTLVRITKIVEGKDFYYKVKMYDETNLSSAKVVLSDCGAIEYASVDLNIDLALSESGYMGVFTNVSYANDITHMCLNIVDTSTNNIQSKSYHKIKIG